MRTSTLIVLGLALLASIQSLYANDSAAEVAAGGIQLRKEARISMEKERLTVSLKKVTVEYEFLNTTDQDIETEVAFPTPPYDFAYENRNGAYVFSDFRIWADDEEVKYQIEAKAKFNGADYTEYLQRLGIEIHTFGHMQPLKLPIQDNPSEKSQIDELPKDTKDELTHIGLIEKEYGLPTWTVLRTYHWKQVFPARKVLHIRHEYEPVVGIESYLYKQVIGGIPNSCTDTSLEESLRKAQETYSKQGGTGKSDTVGADWVKYILTTANNWTTPIKTFELVVEDATPDRYHKPISTTVCWEGKVERLDSSKWFAKRANYVPTSELAVYYFREFIY